MGSNSFLALVDWPTVFQAIVGGALGGSAVVFSLSRWLGDIWLKRIILKEKSRYDREIETLKARFSQDLENYKARIDRSVFVTRSHFETELSAYKLAYEGLGDIRLLMAGMRPMLGFTSEADTEEIKLSALGVKLQELAQIHDKTMKTIENLCPFYPQDIYEKLSQCLCAVRGEILDVRTGGKNTFGIEWFRKGRDRMDAFLTAYQAATEAIRDRISNLAVIP